MDRRSAQNVQVWWLIVTRTTLVLFLAGYGTVRLLADGSGGGQGPNPIAVIATAGGESGWCGGPSRSSGNSTIASRAGEKKINQIEGSGIPWFSSTSPRWTVITGSWPVELGEKSDANPGVNNVAPV